MHKYLGMKHCDKCTKKVTLGITSTNHVHSSLVKVMLILNSLHLTVREKTTH